MANKKVVVDPVTRIEGHLRMQAVLDENNVIVDAMSTGTMWRGLEVILKDATPVMHGPLWNASAASAPVFMLCLPFARLKTPRNPDSEERQHHPQPDERYAVQPGPPDSLLSAPRLRLD